MKTTGYTKTINSLLSNLCFDMQQSDREWQVCKPRNGKEVLAWTQFKFQRMTLQPSCLKPMLPTPANYALHLTPPHLPFSLQDLLFSFLQ